jgi:hypothetical protein
MRWPPRYSELAKLAEDHCSLLADHLIDRPNLQCLAKRPGFDAIPAVKYGALHEIKSPLILQPGPAALTHGVAALQAIIANAISLKT